MLRRRDMRRRALALAGLWLAGLAAARAESPVERAASVVAEVCVGSASSAGAMAAGDAAARRYGWAVNPKKSGTQKGLLPIAKDKAIAIVWRRKVWDFVGHDGANGSLSVQVLASGKSGQRLDSCQVAVPGDVAADVEAAIGRKVSLDTRASLASNANGWVLSGDMARPDRGYRVLAVSTQESPGGKQRVTAAGVLDFKLPGATAPAASVP